MHILFTATSVIKEVLDDMRAHTKEPNLNQVREGRGLRLDGPIVMVNVKLYYSEVFIYYVSKYMLICMYEVWVFWFFLKIFIDFRVRNGEGKTEKLINCLLHAPY